MCRNDLLVFETIAFPMSALARRLALGEIDRDWKIDPQTDWLVVNFTRSTESIRIEQDLR